MTFDKPGQIVCKSKLPNVSLPHGLLTIIVERFMGKYRRVY
jgi:hypothetical protein